MNEMHLELCASDEWRAYVENDLVPPILAAHDLGDTVLELGPGPGLTTDVLRRHVPRLVAVEVDPQLAASLADRLRDTNVEVVHADATDSGLDPEQFSAATCFTMLHHVPSPDRQDRLFAEVFRLLRPGGVFVGTDAVDSPRLRELHVDDTFVPVDPATLPRRLAAAGLADIDVKVVDERVRFSARRPA